MKRIQVAPTLLTIEGRPFRVVDRDSSGDLRRDADGTPLTKEANLIDIIKLLSLNIPLDKCTMQDSINAGRLFSQIAKAQDGLLVLEEAEHDWIKKIVESFGPRIFGVNACVIKEALEQFERKHEPKGKGKAQGENEVEKEG